MESRGATRVLTLNRPDKLNAADLAMQRRILEHVRAIADIPDVGAVVLTGSGRAFCSGGDLSVLRQLAEGAATLQEELGRINRELFERILGIDIPVIAAVNGPAVGFGAALVALCDIVVMAEAAYLSEPHVKYGLPASPAIQLIWPELTSRTVAKELLLTGRRIDAFEAQRLGLANHVVSSGQELTEALRIADELMAMPRAGVAAIKQALNDPLVEEGRRQAAVRLEGEAPARAD